MLSQPCYRHDCQLLTRHILSIHVLVVVRYHEFDPVAEWCVIFVSMRIQECNHEQVCQHLLRKQRPRVVEPILAPLHQLLAALLHSVFNLLQSGEALQLLGELATISQLLICEQMLAGPHVISPAVVVAEEHMCIFSVLVARQPPCEQIL